MNSSRSLKRLLLAAVALVALPVSAFAQTSRVEAIHVQGDYIKDYTGIFTYTPGITNVGSLAYGELGNINGFTTLDRSVGVVLGNLWDGRFGTWAIHLREETPQLGQGDAFSSPAPGSFGFDPNVHTNESFDIMWGKKFGTTSVGLRLNRSYFKFQEDLAGVTTELEFDAPSAFDPNFSRNIIGFGGASIATTTLLSVNRRSGRLPASRIGRFWREAVIGSQLSWRNERPRFPGPFLGLGEVRHTVTGH